MNNNTHGPSLIISSGNEIDNNGKILGGTLILICTLFPFLMLIAMWPNKLPAVGEQNEMIYEWKWFHVSLADTPANRPTNKPFVRKINTDYIHLNTILFSLVAFAGFLGSMIHLGSSFTNYVGSEKLKKSWILWYVVKPFTGVGIALILYLVLRAGLLNYGDSNNVNLYGIVTLAAFAGLFTDKATMKLEELFTVLFRPKDDRPDKFEQNSINLKVTGIQPEQLLMDEDNNLIISGEGLDRKKMTVKINGEEISNPVIKGDSISFSYKIPEELREAGTVNLQVVDENGNELYNKNLTYTLLDLNNEDDEKDEKQPENELIKG